MKRMRDEEEARIEAEEVSRAAERFKNVGSELNEWEEKHGNSSPGSSTLLPQLGFTQDQVDRRSSSLSLYPNTGSRGAYDFIPLNSSELGTPTTGKFSMIESPQSPATEVPSSPAMTDPELESKMRLLAEVKKAREEVQGSLDKLRAATPTPSLHGLTETARPDTPKQSLGESGDVNQHLSNAKRALLDWSRLEERRRSSQGDYIQERRILSPPETSWPGRPSSAVLSLGPSRRHSQCAVVSSNVADTSEQREGIPRSVKPEILNLPQNPRPAPSPSHSVSVVMRQGTSYQDRPTSLYNISPGRVIVQGSEARLVHSSSDRPTPQRTMAYDELAERHRKRMSRLQEPVTARMREQMDEVALENRESRSQKTREMKAHREQERMSCGPDSIEKLRAVEKQEALRTIGWRRSMPGTVDASVPEHLTRLSRRMSSHAYAS